MPNQTYAAISDCTVIFDLNEQRYLFVSPGIADILGIPAAQLNTDGSWWLDFVIKKERESIDGLVKNLLLNEGVELCYTIHTPQQVSKHVCDKKSLVIDGNTGHKVLISVIREQPITKPAVAGEVDVFKDLFYKNANPVWILDMETLRIVKVNQTALTNYGYTEEEFLMMTVHDLRPHEEIEKVNAYLQDRERFKVQTDDFNSAGVWKHQAKNGDVIYADLNWFHVKYNNRDCIISIAVDVTAKVQYQEEAKRREQFLSSLIDSQTNFLIRIDIKGCFSFVNRQFLKTFGYKQSELIGQHFSITTLPQELHLCEAAFIDCVNNPGKMVRLQHKKPDTHGGVHDTDWEFIAITDDTGCVCEIQGIGIDITNKLKIEQDIKDAADKLDAFIESITDSFFIVDNNWRFVKVNSAFEKVTNTPREEMIGQVIWDVYPEIMESGFGRNYYEAIERHETVKFTEYFEPKNKWFSTSVYPSAEGSTFYVKDITHERRAQEEATWTKNSLEALINNTHDHIWSVDRESRYVYMNDAYVKETWAITGVEPISGDFSYMHKGYNDKIIADWKVYYQRALNGEQYTIISESLAPDRQSQLYFEVSFNPIYTHHGEIIGVGCFARDITQRLKIEQELLTQNERLRNIASLSSHEIRRPVASMMGLISIMDKDNFFNPENEQIIDHIFTVSSEIDDVIRLIVDSTFTGHP
jgi:PAS domain S-box-containing protein